MVPSLPPFTISLGPSLVHGKLLLCSYKIILCKEAFTKRDNQGLHFEFLDKLGIIPALIQGSLCCQRGEKEAPDQQRSSSNLSTPLANLFKYLVSLVKIHSMSKLLVQKFLRGANYHNALGRFYKTSSFLNSTLALDNQNLQGRS